MNTSKMGCAQGAEVVVMSHGEKDDLRVAEEENGAPTTTIPNHTTRRGKRRRTPPPKKKSTFVVVELGGSPLVRVSVMVVVLLVMMVAAIVMLVVLVMLVVVVAVMVMVGAARGVLEGVVEPNVLLGCRGGRGGMLGMRKRVGGGSGGGSGAVSPACNHRSHQDKRVTDEWRQLLQIGRSKHRQNTHCMIFPSLRTEKNYFLQHRVHRHRTPERRFRR